MGRIDQQGVNRRSFLARSAGAMAAAYAGPLIGRSARAAFAASQRAEALSVLGRTTLRAPDSLPAPSLPAGTDTMPQVEHVVVLMLENHSFDNFLGMLGRGDGFTLGRDGLPTASNPYPDGRIQRAFRMPSTCQLHAKPSQEWRASHVQYDGGRNDGFVRSYSGPVARGSWTRGGPAAVNHTPIESCLTDAAAGTRPSFSLLAPDYGNQSQETPQNIVVGESFLARVVHAIGSSPLWRKTLFILTYVEHGGYYDHVPPPAALAPDAIPPAVRPGESLYDGFARYGFRVPSVIVGPYAKPGHVSHTVYDHTSILAFLERKWNLPALTFRDANANDLTDFLDLSALAAGTPTFPELPPLAASGENARTLACLRNGPGTVPPPGSVHRPAAHRRKRKRKHRRHHHRRHHHRRHREREDPEFTG